MKEPSKETIIIKVTWISIISNLFLTVIKIFMGILGSSHVVVADGIHSLSDLVTDFSILIGARVWDKPADSDHQHGHYRIETLVTLSIGAVLAIIGVGIFYQNITTITEPSETPTFIAFWAGVISLISKEALYQYTHRIGKRIKSSPLMANAWHHRSDAFSSIPTSIAVLVSIQYPHFNIIDKVGAVIVSCFILYTALKIIKPSCDKLTDKGVTPEEIKQIHDTVKETAGVLNVHDIRTRFIGCNRLAVDLHIVVDATITIKEAHDVYSLAKKKLFKSNEDIADIIIHIDPSKS